jgi:hypothetical protein
VPRPGGCVDSNDHKSSADSRTCSVLCFRRGFQPGERAVRSRGYDRSARHLLFRRTAEPLNLGQLRCASAPALPPFVGWPRRIAPRRASVLRILGRSIAERNETHYSSGGEYENSSFERKSQFNKRLMGPRKRANQHSQVMPPTGIRTTRSSRSQLAGASPRRCRHRPYP